VSTLLPYTTLFRSCIRADVVDFSHGAARGVRRTAPAQTVRRMRAGERVPVHELPAAARRYPAGDGTALWSDPDRRGLRIRFAHLADGRRLQGRRPPGHPRPAGPGAGPFDRRG